MLSPPITSQLPSSGTKAAAASDLSMVRLYVDRDQRSVSKSYWKQSAENRPPQMCARPSKYSATMLYDAEGREEGLMHTESVELR